MFLPIRRPLALLPGLLAVVLATSACRVDGGRQLELEEEAEASLAVPQHCDVAAPPPGVRTVQVVFSCDEVPVGSWRVVPEAQPDTLRFALESLLAGPTAAERDAGLGSFFSDSTAAFLNNATVRDGVAYIDFRNFAAVIPNASSSAGSTQLLDQVAGTVFQFDGIAEAELSFDGSCDAFWEWLQRGCQRLTRGSSEE